jgi:hypothetical protein
MFRKTVVAAILLVGATAAQAQTPAAPCHFDNSNAMGTSSVPVKGWIRKGARCGVRFSAPSAIISVGAAPAHGALVVDQNQMAFMYTAPKDYAGSDTFTVMLSLSGQTAWFNYDLDVR